VERDEAITALQEVARRSEDVRRGARWPVTLLTVWGATTLIAEFATAFLSGPWTLIPVGVVVLPFVIWAAVYANRQPVHSRGFTRRYLIVVGAWGALHLAYLQLLTTADLSGNAAVALIGSLMVAAPLFVGAYVESTRQ
jgi:hypothetical protein